MDEKMSIRKTCRGCKKKKFFLYVDGFCYDCYLTEIKEGRIECRHLHQTEVNKRYLNNGIYFFQYRCIDCGIVLPQSWSAEWTS
jgi:hypothetical protein